MKTCSLWSVAQGLAGAIATLLLFLSLETTWAQKGPAGTYGAFEPDRVVEAVNAARTTRLAGALPAWVDPVHVVGTPAEGLPLNHLTVLLARSPLRDRAFHQRLEDQQNPASPEYHHWLTPDQIGEQYGVTQHDLEAVQSWLQSFGLHVEQVSKSRTVVSFSGTVAQVQAAFAVTFKRYGLAATEVAQGAPRERLSVSSRPRVPSALLPVISAIGGLSEIPVHPYGHAEVRQRSVKPQFSYCNSSSGACEHFIAPQDFATIFDLGAPVFGNNGIGPRIAIVGRSRVDPLDIQYFLGSTGIVPSSDVNTLIPPTGSEPGTTNDADQLEATIDVSRALGTAPDAPVDLIISADSATQSGIYMAALYEVNTVLDPVMNISFGSCEADAGAAAVAAYDNLSSQAAGEGISIFVSSGDAGAAGCDSNNATPPLTQVESPNYICSSSYVTCVGGTEFNDAGDSAQYWSSTNGVGSLESALGYIPEGGWNEPTYVNESGVTAYHASASGGGVSRFITKPSWQTGLGVPDDGFRDTPDIAFPSSAHDGYYACAAFIGADCSQGYFAYVYGTSTAAPSMAGITAELGRQRNSPLGNLNPLLYATAADASNGAFHDTTVESSGVTACSLATPSMCNNSTPSPTALAGGLQGYAVTPGYDLVTGWGSLDGLKFANAALPPLLTPNVTDTTVPVQVTTNQSFSLQATVSGSGQVPTGTVTWFTALDNRSSFTAPLVNGVATLAAQIPIPGQYSFLTAYSGDGSYASAFTDASITPVVVVTAATGSLSPTILIVSNPTSINVGQSAVFTATVQGSAGTPTGTVQFISAGQGPFGPPVSLVNGVASSSPLLFLNEDITEVVADYFGDAQYQGGYSNFANFSLQDVPAPLFSVSAPSLSLNAGQATGNTATITVGSQNYNDTITFTCTVTYLAGTAHDLPVCSLPMPATLTLSSAEPSGTITATFVTVASSGAGNVAGQQPGARISAVRAGFTGLAALLSLVLAASGCRARRSGLFSLWLVLGLLLGALSGSAIGCGGGGGSGGSGGTTPPVAPVTPGTTAGSYSVTIVASSRTYTSQANFSLTVQ